MYVRIFEFRHVLKTSVVFLFFDDIGTYVYVRVSEHDNIKTVFSIEFRECVISHYRKSCNSYS